MSTPDRKKYRELPVYSFSDWDSVDKVKGALSSLERGMFSSAAHLVDAMDRDDRLAGILDTRVKTLLGKPVIFEPSGKAARAGKAAEEVDDLWDEMFPDSALYDLEAWGIRLGFGLGELVWERGDRWVPRLKVWHPRHVYFDWGTRNFRLVTEGGTIDLPNEPDGKWVIYAPHGLYRGWMHAIVRSLAVPWLIRQWAYRDWARYSEVHGMPIRAGVVPAKATDKDKERFIEDIGQMASENVVRLPQGEDGNKFDLKLIEAIANTWEGFDGLIDKTEVSFAIRLLGQNLTTEVKGGALGQGGGAQIHDEVKGDILRHDGKTLAATLHDWVLQPWATYNLGDPDLAPHPAFETDPPEDLGQKATTFKSLGEGLGALRNAGLNVDVEEVAEEFQLPLGDQPLLPPPSPAGSPPSSPGGSGAGGVPPASKPPEPTATGRKRQAPKGVRRGQLYADELADNARELARKALAGDLEVVKTAIDGAETYEEIRRALVKAFGKMTPRRLAKLTERALILAELAGRHAVTEDT